MSPLALLFVALFNSILGLSVLFPVLAPLGRELGLGELEVGSLSTAYALMQFAMSPYWGKKSDSARKPVLLTGIVGFAVSFFAFGAAAHLGLSGHLRGVPLYIALLAARAIGGTLSSATIPTAQAYVADVTAREERTSGMAVIGAAFGLGVIVGPAIGAVLSSVHLLAPVYCSASLALLNALFVWLRLPEPERSSSRPSTSDLRALDGRVWPILAVALATTLASVMMEQTVAFYFQDRLHLDAELTVRSVGAALVVYGLVAVFAQGYLVRRMKWPPRVLLRAGLPLALAGFVTFLFAHHFFALTLALALQGLGQGLVIPGVTSAVSLAVDENDQGVVAGFNSSAQALGRMLGPLIGTGLYQLRPAYPYALSASLVGLVLLLVMLSSRVDRALGRPREV